MTEKLDFDSHEMVLNLGYQIKLPKDITFEELRDFFCDVEFTIQGELEPKYKKWQIRKGDKS